MVLFLVVDAAATYGRYQMQFALASIGSPAPTVFVARPHAWPANMGFSTRNTRCRCTLLTSMPAADKHTSTCWAPLGGQCPKENHKQAPGIADLWYVVTSCSYILQIEWTIMNVLGVGAFLQKGFGSMFLTLGRRPERRSSLLRNGNRYHPECAPGNVDSSETSLSSSLHTSATSERVACK